MGKKGFVSIATIIIIMVLLIGLMAIPVGINYISSLRKGISATQFAAEALTTCVKSYNESTNAAEFDSLVTIKNTAMSIILGNMGASDLDLTDTFLSEIPTIDAVTYTSVAPEGINISYKGKPYHLDKPAILIAVTYKVKPILNENIEPTQFTVVRKFEINSFDHY